MVTLYIPFRVTVNVALFSPLITLPFLNQIYELPPVAVSSTELPSQIEALAGDMVPVGTDASETTEVFDAGPLQPPWLIVTL